MASFDMEHCDRECPLCMEVFDFDDLTFYPCTCEYQICRFCWHRLRTDENGLCPACRKPYPEDPVNFKPLTSEELSRIKSEKKLRDHQKKQKVTESRKHLANIRVVQKNLVFVVGLSPKLADAETLKKSEYFGRFGKIQKVMVNHQSGYVGSQGPSASAYVTYARAEDALRAIQAVQGLQVDGRTVRASLGTTKYCAQFLRGLQCNKADCMYLHEPGDQEASFTKEDMQAGKHTEYERRLMEQLQTQMKKNGIEQPSWPTVAPPAPVPHSAAQDIQQATASSTPSRPLQSSQGSQHQQSHSPQSTSSSTSASGPATVSPTPTCFNQSPLAVASTSAIHCGPVQKLLQGVVPDHSQSLFSHGGSAVSAQFLPISVGGSCQRKHNVNSNCNTMNSSSTALVNGQSADYLSDAACISSLVFDDDSLLLSAPSSSASDAVTQSVSVGGTDFCTSAPAYLSADALNVEHKGIDWMAAFGFSSANAAGPSSSVPVHLQHHHLQTENSSPSTCRSSGAAGGKNLFTHSVSTADKRERMNDDDLGFDPFSESRDGLAALLVQEKHEANLFRNNLQPHTIGDASSYAMTPAFHTSLSADSLSSLGTSQLLYRQKQQPLDHLHRNNSSACVNMALPAAQHRQQQFAGSGNSTASSFLAQLQAAAIQQQLCQTGVSERQAAPTNSTYFNGRHLGSTQHAFLGSIRQHPPIPQGAMHMKELEDGLKTSFMPVQPTSSAPHKPTLPLWLQTNNNLPAGHWPPTGPTMHSPNGPSPPPHSVRTIPAHLHNGALGISGPPPPLPSHISPTAAANHHLSPQRPHQQHMQWASRPLSFD